ncbi:hypothetical protein V8C86DRAFT_2908952, partial [Haematococcus lacustris]
MASCTVLAYCLLAALGCLVVSALKASEVSGAEQGSDGKWHIEHEGQQWTVLDSEQYGKPFFFVPGGIPQWEDPRAPVETDILLAPSVGPSTLTLTLVTIIPVLLVVGGLAARIWYLQNNAPDLLWPSKERKKKYKNAMKGKVQKARGKWSQDGKGGRSA